MPTVQQTESIHQFLKHLYATQLPLTVDNTHAIDFVRVLHIAGLVEAEIPGEAQSGFVASAKVLKLTEWGREVARKEL